MFISLNRPWPWEGIPSASGGVGGPPTVSIGGGGGGGGGGGADPWLCNF